MTDRKPKLKRRENSKPVTEEQLRKTLFKIQGDDKTVELLIAEIKRKR